MQGKELKDEDWRKGERDDKKRKGKEILEDEVVPTHLEVTATLNYRTCDDKDSPRNEA